MAFPELKGIHHLKLPVSNLDAALEYYQGALNAERIAELDHVAPDGSLFAYILRVPGLGPTLELRLNQKHAAAHRWFDPVTLLVGDRAALEQWDKVLTERGVLHSPILTAIYAWILVLEDPDGNRMRLYTMQEHGPEEKPDLSNKWLET